MTRYPSTLVRPTRASALVFGADPFSVVALGGEEDGERTVHLARLRRHRAEGFTYDLSGPNCVMRWARIPAGYSGQVDVVVHFHGYKAHDRMRLADKAAASGLDLGSPGVARPTLGLVPHGRAFASRTAGVDGFDFPAIATRADLEGFIDEALAAWSARPGAGRLTRSRVILTCHSGGGAALTRLMGSLGSEQVVHGFHYFDATYGGERSIAAPRGWLAAAIARDAAALATISGAEPRQRHMSTRGSALRICFIDRTGTASVARAVDAFMREQIEAATSDAGLREILRRHYRAQRVTSPGQVGHSRVPSTFGGRLLANPGDDLSPEATNLETARARAHELWGADPLALWTPALARGWGSTSLGYGTTWDERIRTTVEGFATSFMRIPVRVGSRASHVHPPYFMNTRQGAAAATVQRHRLAQEHRAAAPAALRALIAESRFANARVGKSTPEMIRDLLQAADQRGLLLTDATVHGDPTPENLRRFLVHYGIGVDCSGFVAQALNRLVDQMPGVTRPDHLVEHSTSSAALKGGQGRFDLVSDPTQLCGGDTMWKSGHIRILAWAERRGDNVVFRTAESRSTPGDIGPSFRYWRLVPSSRAGAGGFAGWQLERSDDLNAAVWQRDTTTYVYGHYQPIRRLLAAAGITPTAISIAPATAPSGTRSAPPAAGRPAPPPSAPAPRPGQTPTGTAPSRVAVTTALTQAEVDRLAAITFRDAASIEAFFRRSGQGGFIDWYNAGLAHSTPFANRGAIGTSSAVRGAFTGFWNQIRTAFDRAEITALDFAAFTAISINETRGNLSGIRERGGAGRTDSRGRHPGLAYFFDRIELRPGRFKASYNHLSGGRTAGSLFDDPQFIDAHGSLAGADRLARHGGDFGGAWNGNFYPQGEFSTAEDAAVNGFIMQADFYKFRGRGVIQTTGRSSYARAVDFVKGYAGSNPVLSDYKRRWASFSSDVAATRSRTDDWDRIFDQSEMLAKGLALHATGGRDYRQMSTTASVLLNVPPEGGNPVGQVGSIYTMGRRISGSGAYARAAYRDRVLALLHGMLAV